MFEVQGKAALTQVTGWEEAGWGIDATKALLVLLNSFSLTHFPYYLIQALQTQVSSVSQEVMEMSKLL